MHVEPRTVGKIERLDPALDDVVDAEAAVEMIAEGFEWTEGPAWRRDGGYLLFSDIPAESVSGDCKWIFRQNRSS